ncbi:MAG: Mannose-6-phosphate isomerase [Candidatus Thorarchaeota archaeon]|nr:MAG: Mannose-6-phosphate isomerase [Candidatus Thorarchaeota archaeon]
MLIRKFDDCEEIIANDETRLRELLNPAHEKSPLKMQYSIAHAIVEPGKASIPHLIEGSSEVYFILHGRGLMHIEDETVLVYPGDTIYIPPGAVQYIENDGKTELAFLCLVSPPWTAERDKVAIP